MRLSTRRLVLTEEDRLAEVTLEDVERAGGWPGIFSSSAPLSVEIGLGKDTHILEQAAAHPDRLYVGFEYARKKLDKILKKIGYHGSLPNLRVVYADVTRVFAVLFPEASLSHVYVFFPDPWPKKRHHGRRTLNSTFVSEIASRLAPGAPLEVRTDNAEYVEQIIEVLDGEPTLENAVAPQAYLPDPIPLDAGDPESHIPTLFESKFRERGLPIHYFYYRKQT